MLQFLSSSRQPCSSSCLPFNLPALKDTLEIQSFPHRAHTSEWGQEPPQLLHHKDQVAFTVIAAPLRFGCPSASLEPGPSPPHSRSSMPPCAFSPVSLQGHRMVSAEKVSGCELSLHGYCLRPSSENTHTHTLMTVLAIHSQKPPVSITSGLKSVTAALCQSQVDKLLLAD